MNRLVLVLVSQLLTVSSNRKAWQAQLTSLVKKERVLISELLFRRKFPRVMKVQLWRVTSCDLMILLKLQLWPWSDSRRIIVAWRSYARSLSRIWRVGGVSKFFQQMKMQISPSSTKTSELSAVPLKMVKRTTLSLFSRPLGVMRISCTSPPNMKPSVVSVEFYLSRVALRVFALL